MLLSEITSPHIEGFHPCNPSIAHGPEGYAIIVTYRNLTRHDNGTYSFADATGVIATRNYFATLDDNLHPITWLELPPPQEAPLFPQVRGIEDPRLYWNDGWHYSGTICEHHVSGRPRIAVCNLEQVISILDAPEHASIKNLMPTGTGFLDIMEFDPQLHGGAVTRYKDGWLGIVHEVRWPGRSYHHRWAKFDSTGALEGTSDDFTFGQRPIEFASGIILHGDDVVISFGVQDKRAMLARFTLEHVVSALSNKGEMG